jgi:hypothetical protein
MNMPEIPPLMTMASKSVVLVACGRVSASEETFMVDFSWWYRPGSGGRWRRKVAGERPQRLRVQGRGSIGETNAPFLNSMEYHQIIKQPSTGSLDAVLAAIRPFEWGQNFHFSAILRRFSSVFLVGHKWCAMMYRQVQMSRRLGCREQLNLTWPPQLLQVSMSRLNARFKRCAQVMAARRSTGVGAVNDRTWHRLCKTLSRDFQCCAQPFVCHLRASTAIDFATGCYLEFDLAAASSTNECLHTLGTKPP